MPGVWNTVMPDYAGAAFYETDLRIPTAWQGRTVRLVFGAANYLTEAWLEGVPIGRHEGGYTPFAFDLGAALRIGEGRLVMRIVDPPAKGEVDGLRLTEVPSSKESWYGGYGGPWGGVWLEASTPIRIEDVFVRPDPREARADVVVELVSTRDDAITATVQVEVTEPDGTPTGSAAIRLELGPDGASAELPVRLGRRVLWSPEEPALYRWSVEVTTERGDRDRLVGTFGLRSCALLGGRFLLNGRERLIKGVLLQPTYPRTLAGPPDERMLARDVELIREAGFNLVRCHLRPPPPGFLDLCDRAGLMAYVETPLAWIQPGPRLLEHGRRELRAMVRRDRNHPSVVLWGLLNENAAAAKATGEALFDELPTLDPTRPAIDNSGGIAVGEVDKPAWARTTRYWTPGAAETAPLNDVHIYLANPLRGQARGILTEIGGERDLDVTPGRRPSERIVAKLAPPWPPPHAILVSEYGCGGLPDFDRALERFGADRGSADARDLRSLRDDLVAGLRARALEDELGPLDRLVRDTQRLQAAGVTAQTLALRRNRHVAGYILTQFADAGWEQMAGLVGLWRDPRPALAAMRAANRPHVLHVDSHQPSAFTGRSIPLEVWFLQEPGGELVPQSVNVQTRPLAVVPHSAPHASTPTRRALEMPEITPRNPYIGAIHVRAPEQPGYHRVDVDLELADRRQERASCRVLVLPGTDRPTPQARIERGEGLDRLAVSGRGLKARLRDMSDSPWGDNLGAWLLQVAGVDDAVLASARDFARAGGHVCLLGLDPSSAARVAATFDLPIRARGARGNFMGTYHYLRRHPIFAGLPSPGLADVPFADVLPAWALEELPGAEVVAGCFSMPDGGPGFEWRATVQTLPYGDGRLTLCQLRAADRPPLGHYLLGNLVRWLVATSPKQVTM